MTLAIIIWISSLSEHTARVSASALNSCADATLFCSRALRSLISAWYWSRCSRSRAVSTSRLFSIDLRSAIVASFENYLEISDTTNIMRDDRRPTFKEFSKSERDNIRASNCSLSLSDSPWTSAFVCSDRETRSTRTLKYIDSVISSSVGTLV